MEESREADAAVVLWLDDVRRIDDPEVTTIAAWTECQHAKKGAP